MDVTVKNDTGDHGLEDIGAEAGWTGHDLSSDIDDVGADLVIRFSGTVEAPNVAGSVQRPPR